MRQLMYFKRGKSSQAFESIRYIITTNVVDFFYLFSSHNCRLKKLFIERDGDGV